jgi:hypothetical protein
MARKKIYSESSPVPLTDTFSELNYWLGPGLMDDFHTVSFPSWYPVDFFSMCTLPLVPTYMNGKALSIQMAQSGGVEVKDRVFQYGFTLCYNLNIPSVT